MTRAVRKENGAGAGLSTNCEIFDILNSHNMLQTKCLQKTFKPSIYNNAKIGKASAVAAAMDRESRNVFEEFDHGWHGFQ